MNKKYKGIGVSLKKTRKEAFSHLPVIFSKAIGTNEYIEKKEHFIRIDSYDKIRIEYRLYSKK